jgi:hypothetical protein
MLYRGKRYIVTATFDGHWAWVVILGSRLSVKGRAITKFEAIEQATHVIDRAIRFSTQQTLPCGPYERLRGFVFRFVGKWHAKHFRRASRTRSKFFVPLSRR